MIKENVEKALNAQIEKEGYSSNLYLAMAIWAETHGMEGTAQWLYAQAEEEKLHMLKFIHYVNERGGTAIMPAIAKPPAQFNDIFSVFQEVLKHERMISESINDLVATAIENKDFSTNNWLQWFVTEQIEEEASVQTIIDKLNLIGDKSNLYLFDKDIFGMRTAAANTAQ